MTAAQGIVLGILAVTILLFLWGRWRHDMVALAALLACVVAGLTPAEEAFAGFGHPAVITVACVLILSQGLQTSGAVDVLARRFLPQNASPLVMLAALTVLAAVLSAFMNNVGALALLMPIALQAAAKQGVPPGQVLMPVSFGSILGGMTTLIGTPPNLIVSGFRGGGGFAMFDFAPVGLAVAGCGVIFIVLAARKLVPQRERLGAEEFNIAPYLTEARVPEGAKSAGMTLREVERVLDDADAQIVGFVRNDVRISAPHPLRRVREGDILVIEADPKALSASLSALGLKLEEAVSPEEALKTEAVDPAEGEEPEPARAPARDEVLMEIAVLPSSALVGRSATDIRLRASFGINLLAISREGRRTLARLRTAKVQSGDVLLLQGPTEAIAEFAGQFGCVPLAERTLRLPDAGQALKATAILALAVAGAAFGLVPAAVAFAGGVLASMVFGVVPPRRVYEAVDWPVIVLLGALIPVAGAMESTGAANQIARLLLDGVAQGNPVIALVLILIVTMTLSDFMNNAATAAVMCPIAIGAAAGLGVSADPFLMAVAVGASCAFLTPIGHQNNTLILGPSGFRFGDYWRLGAPLEIIVIAVGVPTILAVWPL